MNEAVRDCLVAGYGDLITSLSLPDPDDRHVLASAIRAGTSVIVTYNLIRFLPETLARLDIGAQHPDTPGVLIMNSKSEASPARHCCCPSPCLRSCRLPVGVGAHEMGFQGHEAMAPGKLCPAA